MDKINYWNYHIDSGRFYIDKDKLKSVTLPEHQTLIESDTGNIIDEFKKTSIAIPYKDHKITISNMIKVLPNGNTIEKVLIYLSAKVCKNYFQGITKQDYFDVLDYLKSIGYIDFDSAYQVFRNTYCPKDIDFCMDMRFSKEERIEIREWNIHLKDDLFNGTNQEDCVVFPKKGSSSSRNGFGIQTYERDFSSPSKPFIKFYDKSLEIKLEKNKLLLDSLHPAIRNEINDCFIYRYEITFKDSKFFEKYGLSNRFEDLLAVPQIKWNEIGNAFMKMNFEPILRPRDYSKLGPIEKILALYFEENLQEGKSLNDIKAKYVRQEDTKQERLRMKKLFEKVHYKVTNQRNDESSQLMSSYKRMLKYNKIFNL